MSKRKNKERYGDRKVVLQTEKIVEDAEPRLLTGPDKERIEAGVKALREPTSSDLMEAAKGVVANDIETMTDEEAAAGEAIRQEQVEKLLAEGEEVVVEAVEAEDTTEGETLEAKKHPADVLFTQDPDPKYYDIDLKELSEKWDNFCRNMYAKLSAWGVKTEAYLTKKRQAVYGWAIKTNAEFSEWWDATVAPKLPKFPNTQAMFDTVNERIESLSKRNKKELDGLRKDISKLTRAVNRLDKAQGTVNPDALAAFVKALNGGKKIDAAKLYMDLTGIDTLGDATAAVKELAPA